MTFSKPFPVSSRLVDWSSFHSSKIMTRHERITLQLLADLRKGWGQSAKLKKHSRIWGKFGRAIQGYILNPCTKFPPNPTSRKVNNQELTSQHHA